MSKRLHNKKTKRYEATWEIQQQHTGGSCWQLCAKWSGWTQDSHVQLDSGLRLQFEGHHAPDQCPCSSSLLVSTHNYLLFELCYSFNYNTKVSKMLFSFCFFPILLKIVIIDHINTRIENMAAIFVSLINDIFNSLYQLGLFNTLQFLKLIHKTCCYLTVHARLYSWQATSLWQVLSCLSSKIINSVILLYCCKTSKRKGIEVNGCGNKGMTLTR